MLDQLKNNRSLQFGLAALFLLTCFGCLTVTGVLVLVVSQSDGSSAPIRAEATPLPALATEASSPTDSLAEAEAPTPPAAAQEPAPGPASLSEESRRAYTALMLVEGSIVMLEETASQVQTGQSDGPETFGRVLGIGLILKATEEALQQPAADPALQPAWEAAREAVPLIRETIRRWVDKEIGAAEVASALEPARTQMVEALRLGDDAMAQYGVEPTQLADLRETAMADLRQSMTETEAVPEVEPEREADAGSTEAASPALEIVATHDYIDTIDYLHIVGEVANRSDKPQAFVKVTATLYDEAGTVIETDFTYTAIDIVPPGQTVPFELSTDQYANLADYKVQVQGRPADELPYAGLSVVNQSDYVDDIGYRHIVGEVSNQGQASAEFVQVVASLYDEAGQIVGTDFTYADLDVLPPGGTSPFELSVGEVVQFSSYSLQVQGRPTD